MSVRQLIVDGVTVPVWATTDFDQQINPIEAVYQSRKKNGGLVQRTLYTGKYSTSISGGGLAPAGLDDINTGSSITIHCVEPLSISSASNVINIPSNRRADVGSEPQGYAEVNGALVSTPVAMNGDQATLTIVSGATGYQVRWYPILTVIAKPLRKTLARGSGHRWVLEAEEV